MDEADLRESLDGLPSAASEPRPGSRAPEAANYNPAPEREKVRSSVALYLVYLLIGVVGAFVLTGVAVTLGCLLTTKCAADAMAGLKLTMEVVLTPLVGIVASVIGFYFGEKSGSAES